jgi:hypothetical protein
MFFVDLQGPHLYMYSRSLPLQAPCLSTPLHAPESSFYKLLKLWKLNEAERKKEGEGGRWVGGRQGSR